MLDLDLDLNFVEVKRREGSIGIGAEEEKKKAGENWDSWCTAACAVGRRYGWAAEQVEVYYCSFFGEFSEIWPNMVPNVLNPRLGVLMFAS